MFRAGPAGWRPGVGSAGPPQQGTTVETYIKQSDVLNHGLGLVHGFSWFQYDLLCLLSDFDQFFMLQISQL